MNIERSTISKILKEKERWLSVTTSANNSKKFRHKGTKYPLLDQAIRLWIEQVVAGGIFLTESLIKEKARKFAFDLNLPEDSLMGGKVQIKKSIV